MLTFGGSIVPIEEYIARLEYIVQNARFDDQRHIFDESPLKFALISISKNTEGPSHFSNHHYFAFIIFQLSQYHQKINMNNQMILSAATSAYSKLSIGFNYEAFAHHIDNVEELLSALECTSYIKNSPDSID